MCFENQKALLFTSKEIIFSDLKVLHSMIIVLKVFYWKTSFLRDDSLWILLLLVMEAVCAKLKPTSSLINFL